MKRFTALLLVLILTLNGCALIPGRTHATEPTQAPTVQTTGATTEATTEPATEPTTEPTTEPPPVYTNPLTGEVIDAPLENRIVAVTVNNLQDAMPDYGVNQADIFMEMFVNHSIIRCLALFADPSDCEVVGATRSTRIMFTQIAKHYDAMVAHAGGDKRVLNYARNEGVDGFNVDTADDSGYSFRDKERFRSGKSWDACLFTRPNRMLEKFAEQGIDTTRDPEKDFLLRFAEDGTPAGGEDCAWVNIHFIDYGKKETRMVYDEELGKYVMNQYGQEMVDGSTGEKTAFTNVVILQAPITREYGIYQKADYSQGGTGYYACGGQIIPILWETDGDDQPFRFTTTDGEPLVMGVGNSYWAICSLESEITWAANAETDA